MGRLGISLLAALALALPLTAVAQGERAVGSTFIRGAFEYGGQTLDDVREYQRDNNAVLVHVFGLPPSFKDLGAVPGLDFEAGYQVSPAISVGIGFSHGRNVRQSASAGPVDIYDGLGNFLGTADLHIGQELDAAVSEITGIVTYWIPRSPGLFMGVQAGVGMGRFKETWAGSAVASFDSFSETDVQEYEGNAFVGGAFAGYEAVFSNGLSTFVKAGYRHRALGKLKGHFTPLQDGEPAQHEMLYEDLNGNLKNVGFDYSGLFASVGLGVSFGGKER
jgi:hypothetical protein